MFRDFNLTSYPHQQPELTTVSELDAAILGHISDYQTRTNLASFGEQVNAHEAETTATVGNFLMADGSFVGIKEKIGEDPYDKPSSSLLLLQGNPAVREKEYIFAFGASDPETGAMTVETEVVAIPPEFLPEQYPALRESGQGSVLYIIEPGTDPQLLPDVMKKLYERFGPSLNISYREPDEPAYLSGDCEQSLQTALGMTDFSAKELFDKSVDAAHTRASQVEEYGKQYAQSKMRGVASRLGRIASRQDPAQRRRELEAEGRDHLLNYMKDF